MLGAAGASAAPAPGNPEALARAHYQLGLAYYDSARFADAVSEFEKAYALVPRPELLYNLARAQDHAGDLVAARRHYARYLRTIGADAAALAEIEGRLRALGQLVGQLHISAPTGCELRVDGAALDEEARSGGLEVMPGRHSVDAFKDGFASRRVPFEIAAGGRVELRIDLEPARRGPYPVHKKWWFWTATGAVVVGAVLTGVFVGLRGAEPAGIVLPTPR